MSRDECPTRPRVRKLFRLLGGLAGPLLIAAIASYFLSMRSRLGFWTTFGVAVIAILGVGLISALADKD
jgi:hypothetical protein